MRSPSDTNSKERQDPLPNPLHYRFMVALAKRFPPSIGYAIGEGIADIAYRVWPSKRRAAQRNYAQVLGVAASDPAADWLARRAFRNFGRYVVELFRLQVLSPQELRETLRIHHIEHLEQAISFDRGVVFVSAHIGNMEAASAAFPLIGHRVIAVAARLRPDFVMQYMERARAQWGVSLVPVERAGRRLVHALRQRKLVALIADVGVRYSNGVRVTFFGRDTLFPEGPARLARLSGAPLVFGCAVRSADGSYDIIVSAPVAPRVSSDETRDLEMMTQQIVDQMEALIRRYPDQWYMFRDMWPRVPLPPRPAHPYSKTLDSESISAIAHFTDGASLALPPEPHL